MRKAVITFLPWIRAERTGFEKLEPIAPVNEMGALALVHTFVSPIEPQVEKTFYIVEKMTLRKYVEHWEGLEAYESNGIWWLEGGRRSVQYRFFLYQIEAIEPPKTKLETRWEGGRWLKLTARGWKPA